MIDKGVGMQLLACWDCGFESRREYGCLSLVIFVRCLRRDDHSSREVLPSVVSLSATVTLRKLGRRGPLGHLAPWKKEYMTLKFSISHLIFIAKARLEHLGGQNGV